ncbi:MAG: TonB-dependent receptor [Dissulfurimicrobium sp.]|uniref:TonB-dependent receptor n=1 Tax=Dissulfurimicrobium sp. TaxID=2022436 RepID=UPI004049DC7E
MKKFFWISIVFICLLPSFVAFAQDQDKNEKKHKNNEEMSSMSLKEVVVTGEKIVIPTKQTNETVYTGSEITKKGLEIQGTKATTSIYEAIDILPGISVEGIDPYGLAAEQKHIRTRGVRGYLGAMTVEGVPNYGIAPIGPREYIYDTENLESIAVYKGAVPADLGTGVGARGGAIELRPRWPKKDFTFNLQQGIGENNYTRTFLRVDSGNLPSLGTAFATSYSYTEANKWKGPGDLGPRNNICFMVSQPIGDKDIIKIWYNYNDLKQNLYRPLTYRETKELSDNYYKDYHDSLRGTKDWDIYYYNYNRGEYTNYDILGEIPLSLSDSVRVTFKPYYSKEDTDILNGTVSQGGIIQKRVRDLERYGAISKIDWKFLGATMSAGYWFESSDMLIRNKMYDPVSFNFKGYGISIKSDDNGIVHSPYLKLAGSIGNFDWQMGLKYFYYKEPSSEGYIFSPSSHKLVKASDLYREKKEYDEVLPTLGVSYHPSDFLSFYTSYSRNYIRPYAYIPLINTYNQNRSKFQAAGVNLNNLFNGYDMETSDTYELGARLSHNWIDISLVGFYSKHDNLLTTVYDPRVKVSYYQNVGEATGYGVELETNIYVTDFLTVFFNPTYTILTYDNDLTYQGITMNTKNKQVVDTPKWCVKSGIILTYKDFEAVAKIKYLAERYGDVKHKEKIDDYVVSDLKIGYTMKHLSLIDNLTLSLEFTNIFDKKYVSVIDAMDDTREGSASYYVGAPRTTMLKAAIKF